MKPTRIGRKSLPRPPKMDSEKLLALTIELERALEAHDKVLRAG